MRTQTEALRRTRNKQPAQPDCRLKYLRGKRSERIDPPLSSPLTIGLFPHCMTVTDVQLAFDLGIERCLRATIVEESMPWCILDAQSVRDESAQDSITLRFRLTQISSETADDGPKNIGSRACCVRR